MKTKRIIASLTFLLLCVIEPAWTQYTPGSIYTAARSGDMEAVAFHLKNNLTQSTLNNALGAAIIGSHTQIIDLLIDNGADVNHLSSYNTSLLNNAIMLGLSQSATRLIERGADPNVYGFKRKERNFFIDYSWTPLMCAAFKGDYKLVQLLLEKGADPTLRGFSSSPQDFETAADIAAYSGHLKILKLLVKRGSPIGQDTIFKTVRGGHLNTFKYLFKKEKDINRMGANRKTFLMEACWWGNIAIVEYLLKKRADVNFRNDVGTTALIETVNNADRNLKVQLQIVELLIKKGADPSITINGRSALDIAKKHNKKNIVNFLGNL